MTPYPDPLFREGLEHYRKPAPASAWERIESGLDKKKHRSPWLKIAAGLVLMIATSILIWLSTQTIPSETEVAVGNGQSAVGSGQSSVGNGQWAVGSNQSAVSSVPSDSIVERSRNNHTIVNQEDSPVEERTSAERSRSSRNDHSKSSRQSAVCSRQSAVGSQQYTVGSWESLDKSKGASPDELGNRTITQTQVSTVEESIDLASSESTPDPRGTSISYSAEMVNERFIKKDVVAEATPEKKNASGLQKVIEKALDLKNEESLLGDLREKKNDLLTINYPAKKRETNK